MNRHESWIFKPIATHEGYGSEGTQNILERCKIRLLVALSSHFRKLTVNWIQLEFSTLAVHVLTCRSPIKFEDGRNSRKPAPILDERLGIVTHTY